MKEKTVTYNSSSSGIKLFAAIGVSIAVQISWGLTPSVPWAAFHGLLGWFYVLYRWLFAGYLP